MDQQLMVVFENLPSMHARAAFLLEIGVTAKIDTQELGLVYRACVGDMQLPVTAFSERMAIAKGTAWLQDKMPPATEETKQ